MKRNPNESFKKYKKRRNNAALELKQKLKGVMVWCSKVYRMYKVHPITLVEHDEPVPYSEPGMTYKRGMELTNSRMSLKHNKFRGFA